MKDTLIIIGASGHGKVVADIAYKMGSWKRIAFLDDNPSISKCLIFNVIGTTQDADRYINDADFFVAVGDNKTREKILNELIINQYSIVTLIHPGSVIGIDVEVGQGTVVMAGVVINSSVRIGQGVIVNTSASVDHDCVVEDYVHISPGVHLAGNVSIGKRTWLGIGSVVVNQVNIFQDCVIGAGAVVIKSIHESGSFIGSPAKRT